MATDKDKFSFDDFIKKVRPDPKSTEALLFLNGFIGESSIEGHIRVYSDVELTNYVDVPKSSVLHSVPNSKEENSLGGSKLWVSQSGIANQAAAAGSFLEGDVYSNYTSNMYRPGGTVQYPRSVVYNCTKTGPLDPNCGIVASVYCPTRFRSLCVRSICNICYSLQVRCPSIHNSICCRLEVDPTYEVIRTTRISYADGCPTTPPTDPTTVINPGFQTAYYGTGAFNPNVHGYGY